jgi:enoyl-CoA hydratase/carnithine racemase
MDGHDAHQFRQVMAGLEHRMDVRAVVVTGTPPAFCVGGDSKALTGHGERGGYDSGLADDPARPGGGNRLDADVVAARLPPPDHRRSQPRVRRCRTVAGAVLRPPVRRR